MRKIGADFEVRPPERAQPTTATDVPTPRQRGHVRNPVVPAGRVDRTSLDTGAESLPHATGRITLGAAARLGAAAPAVRRATKVQARSSAPPIQVRSDHSTAIRRHYLDNGAKFTGEMFKTLVSGVEVVSYADRHTILGLLNNKGGAKKLNTIVLKPIEMQLVAADAYACAWDSVADKVSVKDGTTFPSCGIRWGIDARPNATPPSIHIYPTEGGGKAIDIGAIIPALRAFKGQVDKGTDVDAAKKFAVDLAGKKGWDVPKLLATISALQQMGDI